jgi:hypothetical protein
MNLIAKLGMGYHNGPFTVTTNGATPNWKGLTWPGPAGESLVAEAIEVSMYDSIVIIDGKRYNSVCFVEC